MNQNVGRIDRILRAVSGIAMASSPLVVPLPSMALGAAVAGMGGYLVLTALLGHCLGYRLMGRSTCPLDNRR